MNLTFPTNGESENPGSLALRVRPSQLNADCYVLIESTVPSVGGFEKQDGTMNKQIQAWPIGANAASIIQNLNPILTNQEFTK